MNLQTNLMTILSAWEWSAGYAQRFTDEYDLYHRCVQINGTLYALGKPV